jgi:RNA polymerase sigma-70 factor (ECF subfamily)
MSVPHDADSLAADIAERYLPQLRVFARRRLRDTEAADDAAQETLRRVLVALREGRVLDLQALPSYVFETARHVCAHHVRRERQSEHVQGAIHEIRSAASVLEDPLTALISAERVRELRAVLSELAPQDRELLRLTYVEGLSADAIAVRVGLTPVNVRVRRHRLQKDLARRLRVTAPPSAAPDREAK